MSGLVQCFSRNCSQDVSQGCSHLKVWLRLEDLLSRWLTHMATGQKSHFFDACCGRRPQFLTSWVSPWDCLSVLLTWRLASFRASDLRESKKEATCTLWPHLGSETPSLLLHSIHLKESLSPALSPGREIQLYLWKRGVSKNLWTYFKTTTSSLRAFDLKRIKWKRSS